jgi:hypothetical protein
MQNTKETNAEEFKTATQHPDHCWMAQIEHWAIAGTLNFATKLHQPKNHLLKSYFGLLNYHLNGEYNWKNVPVYWRWQQNNKNGGERLHVHFAILESTPEFHWLDGVENSFQTSAQAIRWLKSNWTHGGCLIEPFRQDGNWIKYITRADDNSWDSCYSPPIHHLKRKAISGEPAMYFPWYYIKEAA